MSLHLSATPVRDSDGDTDLVVPAGRQDLAFQLAPTRKRKAGWTADKQRIFIETLALTASVAEAAAAAGVDPASAYRLRDRTGAEDFARAWSAAIALSATRLEAVLLDRALNGRVERVYAADGTLVHERRVPSDDLLKWMLTRLDPRTYGAPFARAAAIATGHDPRGLAREALPQALAALTDVDPDHCPTPRIIVREIREGEPLYEGDLVGHGVE